MFSKACEYGIKATIHISHQSRLGKRVSLKEVASAIDSPVAFTAKILQSLASNNIIKSSQGINGGYSISKERQTQLSLHDIVIAIDGDKIINNCALGLKECNNESPCPLHNKFKKVKDELLDMMLSTTILKLGDSVEKGQTVLVV